METWEILAVLVAVGLILYTPFHVQRMKKRIEKWPRR